MQAESPSVLGGVRVLELASPRVQYAGKLFGDMGADVIKVERPGGDAARRIGPFAGDVPDPNGSLFFWHYNTSKRAITLDIETEDGRGLLRRLVESADVLFEGFDPGYLDGLGLNHESLGDINPRLVMGSLTEFGTDGPWRDWKGGDLVQMALGGVMASCGYDDPTAPPMAPGVYQTLHIGCHYLYIGLLAALLERHRSGEGQYLETAIHDGVTTGTDLAIPTWIYKQQVLYRNTGQHAHAGRPPKRQFKCSDGRYLNTLMPNIDATMWHTLVSWLDSEGMAADLWDPEYRDARVRRDKWHHWMGVVGEFIESHDSLLMYHGAQQRHITWAQVRSPEETLEDLHVQDRGFWAQVEHPEQEKTYIYPGAPYPMPEAPWRISRRPPLVGEHNYEVYCKELGLSRDELVRLAESGIV